MRKRDPLTWLENRFLQRYLRGCGIEIGALWKRFPTPHGTRVWYADRLDGSSLEQHYPELRGKLLRPDFLADATNLPVAPGSLDFVIASHVLEHLPFPLRALRSWSRALAPGGALLLKIPDKRYTFDVQRARTPLSHLIEEEADRGSRDHREHYVDWVRNVAGGKTDPIEIDHAVEDLMARQYSIHYHVWIDEDIREIVDFTRRQWSFDWKPVVFWGAQFYRREITVVLVRSR